MPKENTHLYFANSTISKFKDNDLKSLVLEKLKYFYLGSITPDTFYFSKKKYLISVANQIHGQDGNLTNVIIFDLLNSARAQNSQKDLVFILGYITHYVLDIVFHPVINYFSGSYYNKKPFKMEKAIYLHTHLEIFLDRMINHSFLFHKLVDINLVKNLSSFTIICEKFKIDSKDLEKVFKRQLFLNKMFKSNVVFNIIYLLNKYNILTMKNRLALFYGNIKKDKTVLPLKKFTYKDLITGEMFKTSINKLYKEALNLAQQEITAAYKYYQFKMSYADCSNIIAGISLDTGKLKTSIDDILSKSNFIR